MQIRLDIEGMGYRAYCYGDMDVYSYRKYGMVQKDYRDRHAMQPMLTGRRRNYGKYRVAHYGHLPHGVITKACKLEAVNANRSVKKAERHMAKLDIRRQCDEMECKYDWT